MRRLVLAALSLVLSVSSSAQESTAVPAVPQAVAALRHLQPQPNAGPFSWTAGPYVYDGAGNIARIGGETYSYDTLSRLTSAKVQSPNQVDYQTQTFTYDVYGNLATMTKVEAQQTTTLSPSDTTNRLPGMTYDSAGNVTDWSDQHYKYDAVGMMNAVHVSTSTSPKMIYAYTADDERL
ncbi:MAG: hypothetical protein JOZ54_08460, partial [Acidobacteria bacterium]|nr:hypothetical protein [Acidobacteriota bacterium]